MDFIKVLSADGGLVRKSAIIHLHLRREAAQTPRYWMLTGRAEGHAYDLFKAKHPLDAWAFASQEFGLPEVSQDAKLIYGYLEHNDTRRFYPDDLKSTLQIPSIEGVQDSLDLLVTLGLVEDDNGVYTFNAPFA